ncbi:hypothetical protein GCM10023195_31630 [Actinoallomurus liliacearum]|uniref:Uncharacterized protein n=1 Tax=Actinoallomurus liliacearum TaxID=1080073 RepID=A0ABP8TKG9_9ACTN
MGIRDRLARLSDNMTLNSAIRAAEQQELIDRMTSKAKGKGKGTRGGKDSQRSDG